MSVLVLSEQGARLTKRGRSLILFKNGKKIFMYPLSAVERIILLGRIEFSSSLIGLLLRENIEVIFLTVDGRYKGRLCGPTAKNVWIRQKQYQKTEDIGFRLQFAKKIVWGKCRNQAQLVFKQIFVKKHPLKERLSRLQKSLQSAGDLYTVLGLEGSFSALYFSFFQSLLKFRMGFEKRLKHPPPDPINILLSLGYVLLFNNMYGLVEGHGLDPYAGLYHEWSYGHASLVSDLMEEFRAPIVDRLVLNLVNRQQIKETDFDFDEEKKRLRLNKKGLETFVQSYRQVILKKRNFKGEQLNYLQIFERQILQFRRYLVGEKESYETFTT